MQKKILLFGFLFVLIFNFFGCSEKLELIKNGQSDYKIFLDTNAIPAEHYSARELQKYIFEISNCTLPIVNTFEPGKKLIILGINDISKQSFPNTNLDNLGEEEYIIITEGDDLLIAGGKKRGTLYGVIGFLSDVLGCRWYTPDFKKIPTMSDIIIPILNKREKPHFAYREAWYREAYHPQWAVHNRLNPSIQPLSDSIGGSYKIYPFVHTFYNLVPPKKYFKTNPEFFSLVNGKRKEHEAQLCLTNSNVIKLATETVFKWIKENPDADVFSVDQNDGYGFCECENCRAIDESEGSQSGTIINFVNQIADAVAKVYPTVKLQTLAYAYSEIPPKYIKPHPIIAIRLCHYNYCSAHSLLGCSDHKIFIERLKAWSKIADRITIWDYFTDFSHYLVPFPNFESLKNDVRFYADNNCIGLFAQGSNVANNGGGEFASLRAWVFAHLMWDPYQDPQLLIDEFVENVYGQASPFIKSYINLLHNKVRPDSVYFSIYSKPSEGGYLTPEVVKESVQLFKDAEVVALKDSLLLKRVELASLPIIYTQLYFYSIGGDAYLDNEDMPMILNKFKRIIADNNIVQLAERMEGDVIAKFIESVRSESHFLTNWWIIGPFKNPNQNGLNIQYPPEEEFDSLKSYSSGNNLNLKWKKVVNKESGYIDFTKMFEQSEIGIAYARIIIELKKDCVIKFGIGSNDGIKVWINGEVKLDHQVLRKAEPNQDIIRVNMNKGPNEILLKIDQVGGGWGYYFSIIKGSENVLKYIY